MSGSKNVVGQVDLGKTYLGDSKSGVIQEKTSTKRDIFADSVVIDITHSGLCGTDLHMMKKDMVLGHEGVGIVSQVGPEVTNFKKGDRVGYGYVHDADGNCSFCLQGQDTMCDNRQMFGYVDLDQGSLGERVVIRSSFVHRIPDAIPLKYAAPLQCAGATVFGAAHLADVRPWTRAGVVGIGGLGHLAIQFLKAMGIEVVAFSTSDSKKDEALKLGASEFVATKSNPDFKGVKPVDYLFVSTDRQIPWGQYFKVVSKNGKIVPLSVSDEDMKEVPYMQILASQFTIQGSLVADRYVHRLMLEFAARHKVFPIIEELPLNLENVRTAAERLGKGDVRYRFVLSTGVKDPLENGA